MFSGQNIKHPPGQLDTIINEIERLRTTGKLKEMIKASGQASFIDSLIEQFNIEND